ncbi:hypothetical protein HK101_005634, partial [Irineochytrium annulatum]
MDQHHINLYSNDNNLLDATDPDLDVAFSFSRPSAAATSATSATAAQVSAEQDDQSYGGQGGNTEDLIDDADGLKTKSYRKQQPQQQDRSRQFDQEQQLRREVNGQSAVADATFNASGDDNPIRPADRQFGEVTEIIVMVDTMTQRSRGFGFVTFSDTMAIASVLAKGHHVVDGKRVDPKRAVPRDGTPQHPLPILPASATQQHSSNSSSGPASSTTSTSHKVFVGGLPPSVTAETLTALFSTLAVVTDCNVMMDTTTQRSRGFGFVTFDSAEGLRAVLEHNAAAGFECDGRRVDVKLAVPKHRSNNGMGGGG